MESSEKAVRVLIGDNTLTTGSICASILKDFGFETVMTSRNGRCIFDAIQKYEPDVVLCNVFLSEYDAMGVMQQVRSAPILKKPIFMVFSSNDSPELEEQVLKQGASYYFLKPADYSMVAERIRQMIGSASHNTPTQQHAAPSNSLEILVTSTMHQIGIPAHIKGYSYIRTSIILAIRQPQVVNAITKQLYPAVAKQYETTPSRVERAIRHAIEVAWDRGDVDVLSSFFGYTINNSRGKPTNSEFIALIADKLRLQIEQAS